MSFHTSLMWLAVASSPLLLPLEAVASQTSSSSMGNHLLLLIIVAALGIAVLATSDLRRLASVLGNDDQGTPGERRAEAEPDELLRCMRDAVDNVASPPKYVSQASKETCAAAAERLLPVGQDSENLRTSAGLAPAARQSHERSEGNRDTPTRMQDIADGIGLIDAISSQTDLLALGVAAQAARIRSRYPEAGEVATEMRMLAEHSQLKAWEIGAVAKSSAPLAERAGKLLINDTRPSWKNARHLVFTIGDEHFAISTLSVKEILVASRLTAEPRMPPDIRGAVALHGTSVPVIDLGARIGKTPIEIDRSTRILAIEVTSDEQPQVLGVAVDSVCEVLHFAQADIEPPSAFDTRIRNDFTLGIAKVGNHTVTLLDLSRGFSVNELVVLRSAARSTEQREIPT